MDNKIQLPRLMNVIVKLLPASKHISQPDRPPTEAYTSAPDMP